MTGEAAPIVLLAQEKGRTYCILVRQATADVKAFSIRWQTQLKISTYNLEQRFSQRFDARRPLSSDNFIQFRRNTRKRTPLGR